MTSDRLDIVEGDSPKKRPAGSKNERPYVGVLFICCNVYARVYLDHGTTDVIARCPRCGRAQRLDASL